MTTEVTTVDASEYDLPPERAVAITEAFAPMTLERESVVEEYAAIIEQPITQDVCDEAGALRKRLVKIRTGTAKIHKTQKHLFLKAGQFVDALKNAATEPVIQMEEKLRSIENHFIDIENAKIEAIEAERVAALEKLEVENIPSDLGIMEDDAWEAMLGGYTVAAERRAEAARIAEEERIAQEEATKRENERLAEENRKQAEALAAAEAEKQRIEQEAAAERAERERIEQEKRASEAEAAAKEAAAKAQAESVENQRAKNCEARDSLVKFGRLDTETATDLVKIIASGKIANVTINY